MLETESNGCPSEANSKLTSKLTNNKGESHVENENHIKNDGKSSTGSVNDKTVVNNNTNNSNKDANSNENNGQDSRDESAKASTNKNEAANKIKSDSNLRLQNSKSKLANSSKFKPSKTAKADKSSDKANATSHIGNSVVVTEGDLPKQQQQQKEHQTQSRGKSNPTDQVIGVKLNAKSTLAATKITRSEARSSTSPATAKIVKKSKTSLSNQSQAQVVAKKSTAIPSLNSDKTGAIKNSNEAIKKKKRKQVSSSSEQTSNEDEEELDGEPRTSKRVRSQYQPFQSPEALAALAPALYKPPSKPSTSASKNTDDKIVVFSKGDFLAVRNEEGTFFVCRTAQNVYKSSRRFKIQWLNDEKEADVYTPDFYDQTDFECVLTNLKMVRKDKGKYMLPADERKRTMNILERAINVEKGLTEVPDPRNVVSDGVDVSIVGKEEEQELMKINPKPRIKISKEKPAKISSPSSASSGRPKRPSTHEEKEISLRERRRSSEISHKSTSRPSTSVKRERRASNPAPPEAPLEDRRSTRSTSRSIVKEEKKTSASTLSTAVNKSPPSSSSSASSSFSASLRKRRLSSNDHLTVKEVTKSERSSRSSHGERQSYPERMRQPSTIKIVNMSTHEAKRPKIRISLIPNPKVSELERELTFESRDDIPFISSIVDSKLLIRAVNRKDYELIDKMVTEGRICSFCVPRSVNLHRDSLSYAIQKEDLPAIKMLMDKKYLTNLVAFPDVLITRSPGKKQNILILGQTNSTPEAMEVLLYDLSHNYDYRCLRQRTFFNSEIIRDALRFGISIDTIDKLCSLDCDKSSNILTLFLNNISAAVKYGHREIAHHLISIAIKKGGFGFHTLHKEALQEKDLFSVAKPSLVVSRSISNCNITPIHCAAINSDEYYISTLLESHSDSYSVQDTEGWHPIHYAAACDSKGPLKYLISKGIPTLVKDKEGNTPLHIACHAGRVHNVELILSHEANNAGDKHSCIERQNKEGLTPLHIACEKGKEEIVKILLQSGADPEKVTLTGNDKLTPLMVAAQNGHLGIVKMLVEKCVDVEALDRRDRTALLHAIINGHSHVVSYLLKLGANPDTKESFGNTAVHFAVAYGWYFTLKLLIDAGSKLNEPNVCNITPLMIGYIKGHLGLVDLLAQSGVTLDSQTADNSDQTLLMETMKSRPGKSMIDRIQFLAKYSADFSRSDREGSNAFHYLADYGEYLVDEPEPSGNEEPEDDFCSEDEEVAIKKQEFNHRKVSRAKKTERLLKYLTQTIKLLRENGCDYAACNNLKETCFHKAAKYGYFDLIEALLESDCKLSESINEDGNTLLHLIVRHSPTRCLQLLPCFKKSENSIERLRNMMKVQNRLGEVPLASCLINYKSLDKDEQEPDLIDFMVNTLQADVKINVPLETIKNETCINFVNKYCTPKIIGIIQKRLDLQIKESSLNETKNDVSTVGISDNTPATVSKPSESAASQAITVTTTPSPLIQPVPSSDSVSNNLPIPLTQEKSEQKLSSQTSITNNVASKFISNSTVTSETQQPQAQIIKVAETPKTIPIISTTTAATVAPSPLLAQTLTTSSVQSTVAETTHSAQSASVPTPVIAATPSITPISTTPSTQQPTVAQSNLSSKISAKPLDQAELQFKETNEPSVDSHHPQTQVITNKSQTIQAQIETQQQSAAPQSESAVPPQPSIQPQSQTQLQPTAVNSN